MSYISFLPFIVRLVSQSLFALSPPVVPVLICHRITPPIAQSLCFALLDHPHSCMLRASLRFFAARCRSHDTELGEKRSLAAVQSIMHLAT